MEASLMIPFASLAALASGSQGENPSFGLGPSGRRQRHRRFPLRWCRLGSPVLHLLSLVCIALQLCFQLGVCVALGRGGCRSGGSSLSPKGVNFGLLGGRVVASEGRGLGAVVCIAEVWRPE
jgi:hypothetical protein